MAGTQISIQPTHRLPLHTIKEEERMIYRVVVPRRILGETSSATDGAAAGSSQSTAVMEQEQNFPVRPSHGSTSTNSENDPPPGRILQEQIFHGTPRRQRSPKTTMTHSDTDLQVGRESESSAQLRNKKKSPKHLLEPPTHHQHQRRRCCLQLTSIGRLSR